MHLSHIEIENFRSLKHLTVELQAGLNVLVGRNNVGKTNLLHAIRHAVGPSASRGDALWLERDDFYKESVNDTTERTISITLTYSGLDAAERSYFFEIVAFNVADVSRSQAIIHFEASWPHGRRQATIKRTGGAPSTEPHEIPTKLLESLPITFLPALRDAEASLSPGHRSRLALLLRDLAERSIGSTSRDDITRIYSKANEELESTPLIRDTKASLQVTTQGLAGSDYSGSSIKAAEADFEKILRTLQVSMDRSPIGALDSNGLGYNNLLYMAVVLEHLKSPDVSECPLFLIEEPEAHLHPQLTMLLAEYLGNQLPGPNKPQTIVTTHSPTLAASVTPSQIHVLFTEPTSGTLHCNSVAKAGMTDKEKRELQRMMDITRATLYFAKAVILVEGISESLLLPVLAKRLHHDLAKLHISVIPICGVAFAIFKKLLDPEVLGIPIAIVTDGDPPVEPVDAPWREAIPKSENGVFALSDRTKKLVDIFQKHPTVQVFHSQVTFEYDLAETAEHNVVLMAQLWESGFVTTPRTFNSELLNSAGQDLKARALAAWRGICIAKHSGSKAEFAHQLSAYLADDDQVVFSVPPYLEKAIAYVVDRSKVASTGDKGDVGI